MSIKSVFCLIIIISISFTLLYQEKSTKKSLIIKALIKGENDTFNLSLSLGSEGVDRLLFHAITAVQCRIRGVFHQFQKINN